LKLAAREAFLKELNLLEEAEANFGRLETKLSLLGFPECVEAFKARRRRTIELRGAILARSQGREDSVGHAEKAWWESEFTLRERLVSAFHKL
jgi:hypothetical protein